MKSNILTASLVAGICSQTFLVQGEVLSGNSWGESIDGVQLSITISNTAVAEGSKFDVGAEIRNSSTNIVYLGETSSKTDFDVFLENRLGKKYQLTASHLLSARTTFTSVKPGEKPGWVIHLSVDKYYESPGLAPTKKTIPPGDYTLTATRDILINRDPFKLLSNKLDLRIQ